MPIAVGTKLGPYELLAMAGAGGMGEVYRARDTRLDREVAIKILPQHLSSSGKFRERFEREARAISSLKHPNICTLYDVGHQDGIDYLVLEYLEGESLAIVHEASAPLGVFADAARAHGAALEEWHISNGSPAPRDGGEYDAVISLGGAMHPDQEDSHPWLAQEKLLLRELLGNGTPLLGVCLGAQLLADAAGAPARRAEEPEIGWIEVQLTASGAHDPLLSPLRSGFSAFAWHSYICPLPPGATELARSAACLQAFRAAERAWGIQFHAEVTLGTFESWLDSYQEDPDAVRLGIEPERLRRATRDAIEGWNRIGYDLCTRFVRLAGGVPGHGASGVAIRSAELRIELGGVVEEHGGRSG